MHFNISLHASIAVAVGKIAVAIGEGEAAGVVVDVFRDN